MKKALSLLMSIVMLAACFTGVQAAWAADALDASNAMNVEVNTNISGNVTQGFEKQKNIYRFSIASDGYISVNFKNNIQPTAENCWLIALYDSALNELDEKYVKGSSASTDMTSMGLAAGTYYICVHSAGRYSVKSQDTYTLNINFYQTDYWEKEFNENFNTANPINIGSTYSATTKNGFEYEKDFYVFNVTSDGSYRVNISTPLLGTADESYCKMYLYNANYSELSSVEVKGNTQNGSMLHYLNKGTYYICVYSAGRYAVKSTDVYSLVVTPYSDGTTTTVASATVPLKSQNPLQ